MDERTPLVQTVAVTRRQRRFPHSTLRRFCTFVLSASLLVVIVTLLLPYSLFSDHEEVLRYLPWLTPYPSSWPHTHGLNFSDLEAIVRNTPSPESARDWSKYYTSGPHLAGKNLTQAIWTRERWEEMGLKSEIIAYDVYLSYPIDHRLALYHGDTLKFECSLKEDVLDEDPTTANQDIPTFHGYSGSGNVTAQFVYVNFGTYHDFQDLVDAGKIGIAKYGQNFRGLKIKRAQELGLVGMVIYTDPQEDGEITEEHGYKTYPAGPARNPSSVQRGSVQYISPSL
jgi:N-acetylated-alpha-linked acidic dipeptidase